MLERHSRSQQRSDFLNREIGEGKQAGWLFTRSFLCEDLGRETGWSTLTERLTRWSVPVPLPRRCVIRTTTLPWLPVLPLSVFSRRPVIVPGVLVKTSIRTLDGSALVVRDVVSGSGRQVLDCDSSGGDDGLNSSGNRGVPRGGVDEADGSMHNGMGSE